MANTRRLALAVGTDDPIRCYLDPATRGRLATRDSRVVYLVDNWVMPRQGINEDVIRTVRGFDRPVRFAEIADKLAEDGVSRSRVHNSVYRLGKQGRLRSSGKGRAMTYTVEA